MLEKNPNTLRIVYKGYPLPSHKMSMPALQSALAAGKQGKFWEFYEQIYADFRNLTPEKIRQIAGDLGLKMEQYDKDLADPKLQAQINRDLGEAEMAGVQGTPTMFVNGLLVEGRSPMAIQEMIDRALAKQRAKAK